MSSVLACLMIAGPMDGAPGKSVVEEAPTPAGAEVCVPDFGAMLPWPLELEGVTAESTVLRGEEACVEGVKRRVTCRLRSLESVARTEEGGVPLRLEITISEFPGVCGAARALEATLATASPDTGLSYAWDLLLLAGKRLARLHAECTWSEEWFSTLSGELERRLEQGGPKVARKVLCRCGGGCREVGAEPPPSAHG